ncbi:MAG: hypothetical protein EP343_21100 [Deltaproteobacteria bacterium]|nr:MAG: hypothetical protein EP343_21100 [Deltaproteobacteria bacterium]
MKRLLLCVCFSVTLGLLACSSGDGNSNNNNNSNSNATAECEGPRDCWKKICPQEDKVEYKECVTKRINIQPDKEGNNHLPEYLSCTTEKKCVDTPTSTLGGGQIDVKVEPSTVRIQWLRLYIYPNVDMDGKAITCERLKKIATDDPESLMGDDLRRYWPPRDATQPSTTPVSAQQGDTPLPLLFGTTPVTVPAGKHIYVVQGFCTSGQGSMPGPEAALKWWECKENVEFKSGDKNSIEAKLDATQSEGCLP